MNDDGDDDACSSNSGNEGRVARNLFRTDDDDSESDDDDDDDDNHNDVGLVSSNNDAGDDKGSAADENPTPQLPPQRMVIRRRKVLHTWLDEDAVGSIATRLWPAATFLASFLRNFIITECHPNDVPQRPNDTEHRGNGTFDTSARKQSIEEIFDQLRNIICPADTTKQFRHDNTIHVLEIGSGVGLVGLELAHCFLRRNDDDDDDDDNVVNDDSKQPFIMTKVLLTDLETALPLLHNNIQLNFPSCDTKAKDVMHHQEKATTNDEGTITTEHRSRSQLVIDAMKLDWNNREDALQALRWFDEETPGRITADSSRQSPLLVIGSDCVYWECLHQPLEECLLTLLAHAPPGSLCLLAGMRRWKRDTAFYQRLGKQQRKRRNPKGNHCGVDRDGGYLDCVCLFEQVTTSEKEGSRREIMRIYAIRFIATTRN